MGFLDKVKNLFTEEVEEEEIKPQKRETKQVETFTPPKRETIVHKEEPQLPVTESRVEENKEKFVFPVYFDDKDFDDLEKPKAKEKAVEPKETKKEPYQGAKVNIEPEPKKVFKPSPIISPVYGVLDKNYSKDDITTKKESNNNIVRRPRTEILTIDDIRNKAYGTLEDDLEDTMLHDLSELDVSPRHEASNQEALDIFNELDFETMQTEAEDESFKELEKSILLENENIEEVVDDDTEDLARQLEEQKKKLEEISQYMSDNDVSMQQKAKEEQVEEDSFEEDIEDEVENEIEEAPVEEETDEYEVEETPDEENNLNDSELFDLIDSMYDKKEDE